MVVYRIAKTEYIEDLAGTGARLFGGRWNHKGVGMIYTSETRALAILEYLVHVPLAMVPADLSIASLEVPDQIAVRDISTADLPANWRTYPAPLELADLGTHWVLTNDSLLLRVPSAVVDHEYNILINPFYPDMKRVTIGRIENFRLDERLRG